MWWWKKLLISILVDFWWHIFVCKWDHKAVFQWSQIENWRSVSEYKLFSARQPAEDFRRIIIPLQFYCIFCRVCQDCSESGLSCRLSDEFHVCFGVGTLNTVRIMLTTPPPFDKNLGFFLVLWVYGGEDGKAGRSITFWVCVFGWTAN